MKCQEIEIVGNFEWCPFLKRLKSMYSANLCIVTVNRLYDQVANGKTELVSNPV